jgi:hypothetical protein
VHKPAHNELVQRAKWNALMSLQSRSAAKKRFMQTRDTKRKLTELLLEQESSLVVN